MKALNVRLLKGVCSSSCRCVSKLAVVLCEVLLRSGVGGVVYGDSKAMKRPSFQSSLLFPSSCCRPLERVDLLLDGFTPVLFVQALSLPQVSALGVKDLPLPGSRRRRLAKVSSVSVLSTGWPHSLVAWSLEAALPSTLSMLCSWWCCFYSFLHVLECSRLRLVATDSGPTFFHH